MSFEVDEFPNPLSGDSQAASNPPGPQTKPVARGCSIREPMNPETSLARMGWEALMVVTVVYTGIYTVYELMFHGSENARMGTMAKLIVALWTLDIAIRFRTSYRDLNTGFMVRDTWPKRVRLKQKNKGVQEYVVAGIARRYVMRLFIVDVLAVVPCLYALLVAGGSNELSPFFQAGGSRLIKLCRLLDAKFRGRGRDSTVTKFVHAVISALEDRWMPDEDQGYAHSDAYHFTDTFLSVIQLAVMMFGAVHVTGTLWFYYGTQPGDPGWVTEQGWNDDTPELHQWLRSFYWSVTTITTVGYGDISASTNAEMVFTVFAIFLGTLFNAWLIGTVTKSLDNNAALSDEHHSRQTSARTFMSNQNVPRDLQQRILNYQEHYYERFSWFDLQECLATLPPKLECELLEFLYLTDLKNVKCFSTMPERVLIALAGHVIPYQVWEGDVLYQPGDIGREAYVLRQGIDGAKCEITISQDNCKDICVGDGELLGVNALQFGAADVVRSNTATVTAGGDLMLIPRWAVKQVELCFPLAGLKRAVQDYIKERNLRKLNKPAAATGLEPEEETEDSYEEKVRSGVIQCKIATDVESTDSRLARMEEHLANIEELLTKALGENPANENL
jgi:hypothetical protein